MNGEILTANELVSGATVYFADTGVWVQDIDKARLFGAGEADERDQLIDKARADHRLIGVEIEKAARDGARVVAERLRERIRATGPTAPRHVPQQPDEDDHVSV
ncbi:MAG TPA: DUF2849 domain-containing protein [Devosiaceae bacterium]|nr:DUF2849 domain-containing protein [Devosiaceae bacterium]